MTGWAMAHLAHLLSQPYVSGIVKILNCFRMTVRYTVCCLIKTYTAMVPSGQIVTNVTDLDILNDTDSL